MIETVIYVGYILPRAIDGCEIKGRIEVVK